MTRAREAGLIGLLWLGVAAPAFADATAFIGANTTPDNRQTRGLAGGRGLFVIVALEVEYAFTPDDPGSAVPSLKTGSANLLLQTPFAIRRVQPYLTTGGGFYSQTLGAHNEKGLALNSGGGVKISLAGPLRLRVDYRVFKLGNGALSSPAHRIYAGLNLKF